MAQIPNNDCSNAVSQPLAFPDCQRQEAAKVNRHKGVIGCECMSIRGAMKLCIYNFMKNYILNFTTARQIFMPCPHLNSCCDG
jgi:hypothetical protein